MTFCKIDDTAPVVDHLVNVLREKLSGGDKVLWLVPGGSAIAVAVEVAEQLQDIDLSNLTVTLTDERYGEVGHPDSNWHQLHQAGFHLPGAIMVPVFPHGHTIEETTTEFARHLQEYCQGAAYCIGFFGLGADGHTAGILPGSSAVKATEWAVHYPANYLRVTMTPPAIAALEEAVVYAMGEAKRQPLEQLQQDLTVKTNNRPKHSKGFKARDI